MAAKSKAAEKLESASLSEETVSLTDTVVSSVKASATKAQTAVVKLVPTVGKSVEQVVYNGVYFVSYGVTFGALVVGSLIPKHSLITKAISEGSEAARKNFKKRQETPMIQVGEANAS